MATVILWLNNPSQWDRKTRNDRGWEANRNDPDFKQLNYREKDWYK